MVMADPITEYTLSTPDNPYNPFTEFKEWYAYDTRAGHHTAEFLARVVRTSSEMSEADQALSIKDAIDEIMESVLGDLFIVVTKPEKSG